MRKIFVVNVLFLALIMVSCNQAKDNKANIVDQENLSLNEEKDTPQVDTVEVVQEAETKSETIVEIGTSFGNMKVKLYNSTPQHRDNFIKLAKKGFYDGTIFHRVIKNFMVQGGDPQSKNPIAGAPYGSGGPGYTIPAEIDQKNYHKKGALAAARLGDDMNPQRASSGSQFYIVTGKKYGKMELNNMSTQMGVSFSDEQIKAYETIGGTPFLDQQYTVFGEVIEGLDVVDAIGKVRTGDGDRPVQDMKMTVKIVE